MSRASQRVATMLCMMIINAHLFAQKTEWETEKTNSDKITVQHQVSTRVGANGNEDQLVEYIATTTANASMKKLISAVKDVSKHKEFMGQHASAKVKTLSEN